MISVKDKFTTILFALINNDEFKNYVSKEIHMFYKLMEDYMKLEKDWNEMIESMINENEDIINFIYSELLLFY